MQTHELGHRRASMKMFSQTGGCNRLKAPDEESIQSRPKPADLD